MKRLIAILGVILVSCSSPSAYDFLTGRATALGQAVLLSDPSPSEMLALPSGALERGEFRVETALSRAFDLKDLDQILVAGAFRKGRFSFAAGFSQFGRSELYTEQTAKLTVAAHIDSLSLAIGGSLRIVGFGGDYDDLSAGTVQFGLGYRYRQFTIAASADNLTSPSLADGSPETKPLYQSEVQFTGGKAFSLVGRLQVQQLERPRFSLGQHIGLGNRTALMLGLITAPTQFGGGIEFAFKGGRLSYGASAHPVLGLTQTISVSWGNRQVRAGSEDELK